MDNEERRHSKDTLVMRFMNIVLSSRFLYFACVMRDIPRPMLEGGVILSVVKQGLKMTVYN
jgi:hypothetical protein